MSAFHNALMRLEAAAAGRQRGVRPSESVINRSDLQELLRHFHRLDNEARDFHGVNQRAEQAEAALRDERARVAELTAALEFYADKSRYDPNAGRSFDGWSDCYPVDHVMHDKGRRSRKALAGDGSKVAAVVKKMRSALQECEEYFDQRADIADYSDETGHTPNEEMKLLTEIREALNDIGGGDG